MGEVNPKETWGQPPISVYKMESDGAIELDDCYGELARSHYIDVSKVYEMMKEDLEDVTLCNSRLNEPTVDWRDLKRELTEDGLL
jgi:hypothetical protein